ncbi:MAG TPA: hypothetical protein VKC54_00725 [Patescibacteria group bacterium]|nr:hypothetical protein [Patescibacteria group bacterium]
MRRELFIHFAFWLSFFIFITLAKSYFSLAFWPFWLGGIFGTVLPDLDHVIYFYFLSPRDLTSQRFNFLIQKHEIKRMLTLLYETRGERRGLIFHSVFFQIIFMILTFWMISSSSSLFGRGLVLAFALHLSIDQIMDLTDIGTFDNWVKMFPIKFDYKKAKIYTFTTILLVLVFGLLM